MSDDYEIDSDDVCPRCFHSPCHYRDCGELGCEDGWIDRFDEDPLWYDKDKSEMCTECYGTGIERWCPKCGLNLQSPEAKRYYQKAKAEGVLVSCR